MVNYERIVRRIKKSDNIFVMGHKNIDLDSLGTCLAVYDLCDEYKKKSFIVIDDVKFDNGIKKALEFIKLNCRVKIGKSSEFKDKIKKNSLLIIVDTYSEKRSQAPKLYNIIPNSLFIDHHLFGIPINEDYFIDSKVSSTCEIMTHLFLRRKMKINKYVATVMLAGIDIDTNNFSIKTGHKTHEACAFLIKCGAGVNTANGFSRTKLEDYIKIQKIVFKTEFYKKKYAIVFGNKDTIYERKELAMISDTLTLFNNVEASFAIGYIDKNIIGISARSLEKDVEIIMAKFGGGGHKNNAACQIENKTFKEVEKMIKGEL